MIKWEFEIENYDKFKIQWTGLTNYTQLKKKLMN